jgi:hypothetical protein
MPFSNARVIEPLSRAILKISICVSSIRSDEMRLAPQAMSASRVEDFWMDSTLVPLALAAIITEQEFRMGSSKSHFFMSEIVPANLEKVYTECDSRIGFGKAGA